MTIEYNKIPLELVKAGKIKGKSFCVLNKIQKELKIPNGQSASIGDILELVKPLLGDAILIINVEPTLIGERYFVKATVTLKDGDVEFSATSFSRDFTSDAIKYALNSLFLNL